MNPVKSARGGPQQRLPEERTKTPRRGACMDRNYSTFTILRDHISLSLEKYLLKHTGVKKQLGLRGQDRCNRYRDRFLLFPRHGQAGMACCSPRNVTNDHHRAGLANADIGFAGFWQKCSLVHLKVLKSAYQLLPDRPL